MLGCASEKSSAILPPIECPQRIMLLSSRCCIRSYKSLVNCPKLNEFLIGFDLPYPRASQLIVLNCLLKILSCGTQIFFVAAYTVKKYNCGANAFLQIAEINVFTKYLRQYPSLFHLYIIYKYKTCSQFSNHFLFWQDEKNLSTGY